VVISPICDIAIPLRQPFPPPAIRNGRRHSVTRQMIFQISGEVLKRINRVIGFRPVTKAGIRGVVNLVQVVPLVGGLVGGALDAAATKVIGATAKRVFVPLP
jgi:hypothetical protein